MQVLKTSIQRIGRTFPKVGTNKSRSRKEVSFLVVYAIILVLLHLSRQMYRVRSLELPFVVGYFLVALSQSHALA